MYREIHFVGGRHWGGVIATLPVISDGYVMLCHGCNTAEVFMWKDETTVEYDEAKSRQLTDKMRLSEKAMYN